MYKCHIKILVVASHHGSGTGSMDVKEEIRHYYSLYVFSFTFKPF